MIIWFTGLSGAGKTTLSDMLFKKLEQKGFNVLQVDGDVFRKVTKSKNRFTRDEIIENNSRIISFCKKEKDKYDFILVSTISPYQVIRDKNREVFGKDYFEIYLECPLDILIKRDTKGLYKKAIKGEIKNLIGFSEGSPYEIPLNYDLKINTAKEDVTSSLEKIFKKIKEILKEHHKKHKNARQR